MIIAGIIKAIHPDNDAREYLKSSPEISLDEVLQFIKNHCKQMDESGDLYTSFQSSPTKEAEGNCVCDWLGFASEEGYASLNRERNTP